jgi:hypothetical protein
VIVPRSSFAGSVILEINMEQSVKHFLSTGGSIHRGYYDLLERFGTRCASHHDA